MHNLLQDLAIHEAKENKFFTIFSKADHGIAPQSMVSIQEILIPCSLLGNIYQVIALTAGY
jgi:hypothetical protein